MNAVKIVAVIPVHGRIPLLRQTITRLYEKNKVRKVICLGDPRELSALKPLGIEIREFENYPLGKKWNEGFIQSKKYNPDGVLYVGSSDWISDNYLDTASPYLQTHDLIGKRDTYFLDIWDRRTYRMIHWKGYPADSPRKDEPIGIGRLVSRRMLDALNWKPFDDSLDSSLDYSMYKKILKVNPDAVFIVNDSNAFSMSISTNEWPNKHKFDKEACNNNNSIVKNEKQFLTQYFPETFKIFNP